MKNIICVTIIALMTLSATVNAQKKDMDQFTVQVDGLGCPFCAFGLEKKFKEFKGIKNVTIDIETGIFKFNYPAEKALALDAVEAQVEKAGYTPITTNIVRADGTTESNENSGDDSDIAVNDLKETSIFVAGNCGMCEARIEKAAKGVKGVTSAEWDKDTKQLVLSYDASKVKVKDISKAVAKAGHDTKEHQAKGDTYEALPGCCHYERVEQ
ncbi:heavy-metal-associated domain-containing protein [Winogradskyella sp. A3E31]|uniref:heavy-metal-associated domain-containing protein n=1 Tax=Winogradskyella sp. A3E31 TaxID=3349637 RepID=UPI00398AF61A